MASNNHAHSNAISNNHAHSNAISNNHAHSNAISNNHAHHHDSNAMAIFGFWLYILTDVILFGTLFAIFVVLQGNIYGGNPLSGLFDLSLVFSETVLLLTSSFTCGLAFLCVVNKNVNRAIFWIGATFLLGFIFICIEIYEFYHLWSSGNSWTKHGGLSAFFTLVGTHGLHVSVGLFWSIVLMIQLKMKGITDVTKRKFMIFSLFWHFLDIIWIFVFTTVYLMGAI